jgi:hypothetical protein
MRSWLCLLGRHDWEHKRNPEVGGAAADYEQCVRCGKERSTYEPPAPGSVAGGGT